MNYRCNETEFFFKNPVKIFFSYYRPHLKIFLLDMVCAVLISLIDVAFPVVSKFTIDSVIPGRDFKKFAILILILLCVFLMRKVFSWIVNYWGHYFGTLVETDMRRDVFSHLENQSFSFYDRYRTGKLMSRVTTDLFEITELAHHGPEDFLISILTLLGSFVLLLKIRWEIAVIVFVFIPLVLVVTLLSRSKLNSTSKKVKETTAEINAVLESSISGIRVTKAFTNEEYEMNRFENENSSFRMAKKKFYKSMADFHSNIEFSMNLLNVLVLASGGYLIMKGRMSVSDLVAANLFIQAFSSPVHRDCVKFSSQFHS